MTTESISLFSGINAKMKYLNQRQMVISQNVANADTPGYAPKDLAQPDFGKMLKNVMEDSKIRSLPTVGVASTSPNHISLGGGMDYKDAKEVESTYEVSPSGNAVIIEEQLIKSSETVLGYNLMSNVMKKQVGLMRVSLGLQQ